LASGIGRSAYAAAPRVACVAEKPRCPCPFPCHEPASDPVAPTPPAPPASPIGRQCVSLCMSLRTPNHLRWQRLLAPPGRSKAMLPAGHLAARHTLRFTRTVSLPCLGFLYGGRMGLLPGFFPLLPHTHAPHRFSSPHQGVRCQTPQEVACVLSNATSYGAAGASVARRRRPASRPWAGIAGSSQLVTEDHTTLPRASSPTT